MAMPQLTSVWDYKKNLVEEPPMANCTFKTSWKDHKHHRKPLCGSKITEALNKILF